MFVFLFLCIQWRMSLYLPFSSWSKNRICDVLQSCQNKKFFMVVFFFILRVSKYLYKHTYFFHFYSPCIANMFCKCTVIFSKRLQVFFHCKVLQAESCTNGTDCHEVQCFDDFYVACELGTCTCGGHGTVGMSL